MKILKYLFIFTMIAFSTLSCKKGLDPITAISPRADEDKPEIQISYPSEGKIVKSSDAVMTITFELVASDDIELKSIVMQLDGAEIGSLTSFRDYRRAEVAFDYVNLADGEHVFSVTVTDLTGKTESKSVNFKKITVPPYTPLEGEVFYMAFEDEFLDYFTGSYATTVGTPGFAEGKVGQAYSGATDAYLTFPTTDLIKTSEISAAFWMKVNAIPDRAGILTLSPEDTENAGYPTIQNKRTSGLRFFREASGTEQRFKLNVGLGGTNESWNDGGTIDPTTGEWVHFAFTVSGDTNIIYINGEVALKSAMLNAIDWTGCDVLTIMSGVPRFTEWSHFSDLSLLDELHIFNRVLTPAEVQSFYAIE